MGNEYLLSYLKLCNCWDQTVILQLLHQKAYFYFAAKYLQKLQILAADVESCNYSLHHRYTLVVTFAVYSVFDIVALNKVPVRACTHIEHIPKSLLAKATIHA